MATLSFAQLEQLLLDQGASAEQAQIGAAIFEAESSGRTDAKGDYGLGGSGYTSFGIAQIHLPAHPDVSLECALDPVCAVRATKRISDGFTNWHPWSTFTSGAYRRYLGGARASGGETTTPGAGAGDQAQLLSSGSSDNFTIATLPVVGDVTVPKQPIVRALVDAGAALLGLVLLVIGIVTMFRLRERLQAAGQAIPPVAAAAAAAAA